MNAPLLVIENRPMPEIANRGRPRGSGCNFVLLKRLVPNGNPVFEVPRAKALSIKATAWRAGMKLKIRQMVDIEGKTTGLYAIQRLT